MKQLKLYYAKLIFAGFFLLFTLTLKAQIITTIAGNGTTGYSGDGGAATSAELNTPSGVTVDGTGNIYIADYSNNRVRKVSTSGIITTVAGNGKAGYSGDGGPATSAELFNPTGVAVDGLGNIYIADKYNNRIRKVSTSGTISTVAGNGKAGYSGDGGSATSAELFNPTGVAVDGLGNIFIADRNNNKIRKVSASGIISTVAGGGHNGLGDGSAATNAVLKSPYCVAVDSSGNIYIADGDNLRIRKVSISGIINTVAGNGTAGYSGDGGPATSAELGVQAGVAVDDSGNIYLVDYNNIRIRKVSTSGIISTVAGNGTTGYSGDGGPATSAELNYPNGVAVDGSGNIYIADYYNQRIRKVSINDDILIASLIVNDTLNHYNVVKWQTSLEKNVSHFNIQRSTDSVNYTSIGAVNDFNAGYVYSFHDNIPSKIAIYRLEVVFKDGTIAYYYPTANLPVTLASITAIQENKDIAINWHTTTELNTSHFIIQHSTDGSSFTDIGTVKAIGSGANSYSFIDETPTNGINYYRLKSVDKDGSSSYSKVVSVQLTVDRLPFTVVPNPAKDFVTIKGSHIASVQVIDNMGRVVKVVLLKDATNPTISLGSLPAGVYHLRIQTIDGNVSSAALMVNY